MDNSASTLVREGRYLEALLSEPGQRLTLRWVQSLLSSETGCPESDPIGAGCGPGPGDRAASDDLAVATAALNAFLQINVTGPVPEPAKLRRLEDELGAAFRQHGPLVVEGLEGRKGAGKRQKVLRKRALDGLAFDGVAPYPYIASPELFALARWALGRLKGQEGREAGAEAVQVPHCELQHSLDAEDGARCTPSWVWLRVLVWHYRLLVQPSPGGGSAFSKSAQWSDLPSLQDEIEETLQLVEDDVLQPMETSQRWTVDEKVLFLLEKANACIMFGQDRLAREALKQATELHGFVYALSGALGKRTRFQETSTSQLVVLAKSRKVVNEPVHTDGDKGSPDRIPEALRLNDDTLLESIGFDVRKVEDATQNGTTNTASASLPRELGDLAPDNQPQLSPLDQLILLTDATVKDAFSPADGLTSEEVLPFATRVISDKATNWQIYTQALLVRSRIELHRSRTLERGVLQMQAVVDQIVVDTTTTTTTATTASTTDNPLSPEATVAVPQIQISNVNDHGGGGGMQNGEEHRKPGSIFPAAKPSESASAKVRLAFVHAAASPPRWHVESELAFAWAGVGSLASALDIFQRLRLWAEVALCLAANGAGEDEDGRRSGGEEKAKAVVRWQLFQRTVASSTAVGAKAGGEVQEKVDEDEDEEEEEEEEVVDIFAYSVGDFSGPEQSPLPANAARLFCILGDLENEPAHYERAWEISNHRYTRAQRSLGEHYLQQRKWEAAREAYRKAVAVNRLNAELWTRLGDISIRLEQFQDAADAYGHAVASLGDATTGGGDDAKTWSNLGSVLYRLYAEAVEARKNRTTGDGKTTGHRDDGDPIELVGIEGRVTNSRDPAKLLARSLAAYKRGAIIAHDNWRIWENVLTLASRMRPPAVTDMLQALRSIISNRKSEDALDVHVLRKLLNEAVLSKAPIDTNETGDEAVYDPPRGSVERAVCQLLEGDVAPLITTRSELWELLVRERVWIRDYAGAVDAAERGWRAATSGAGSSVSSASSLAVPTPGTSTEEASPRSAPPKNWLEDKPAWAVVVERTDDLVSVLENYGPRVADIGSKWKGKARSAVRSVMSRAKENWEGTQEWEQLKALQDGLK